MKSLLFIALLALVACGGGGDDTDDSSHDVPTPKVSCRVDGSCL